MPGDIIIDEESVKVVGHNLTANVFDLDLDHKDRRLKGVQTSVTRRALVHDFQDGLTLNFAEDYPGGVTINGDVKVPKKLVAGGDVQLKTSGHYSEPPNLKISHGTFLVTESGTRTISIENGTILVQTVGTTVLGTDVNYTYDLISEINTLRAKVNELTNRFQELEKKVGEK